jgi:hypothetical protein
MAHKRQRLWWRSPWACGKTVRQKPLAWILVLRTKLYPPGKQWHAPKKAFRPASGLTSYEQRAKLRVTQAATKAKEKELKEEKEAERKVHISPEGRYFDERPRIANL